MDQWTNELIGSSVSPSRSTPIVGNGSRWYWPSFPCTCLPSSTFNSNPGLRPSGLIVPSMTTDSHVGQSVSVMWLGDNTIIRNSPVYRRTPFGWCNSGRIGLPNRWIIVSLSVDKTCTKRRGTVGESIVLVTWMSYRISVHTRVCVILWTGPLIDTHVLTRVLVHSV